MRGWAFLALLSLTVSGCFGGGGGGGEADEEGDGETPMDNATAPPPPMPTTDTLWLAEAPGMSPAMPNAEVREPMPVDGFLFFGDGGGQDEPPAEWEHTITSRGNVTGGTLHAWIEVAEDLYNPPYAPDSGLPGQRTQCTWRADVVIEFVGSPIGEARALCVNDSAATISAGEVELEFEFDFGEAVVLEGNTTLLVRLSRQPFSASPDDAVFVLGGTAEYDTWIRLEGLMEPVAG